MSEVAGKGRTGWDWVLGGLLVVVGIVLLFHAVIATAVSVLFIGWLTFVAGIVTLVMALFSIGKEGFWTALLGGGLLGVLGFVMLRNPGAAALTLTLIAGALFLATGIARLAAAVQFSEARVPLVISGGISTLLGLLVLFNLVEATFTLLGVILAVEAISEGVAIMVAGRKNLAAARLGGGRAATTG
jgi:uncharacterized membrane protein HdeD (DUF308 family)